MDKYHEIFQNYRNVIICSIRGEVSFASKLAGGGKTSLRYFLVSFLIKLQIMMEVNHSPDDYLGRINQNFPDTARITWMSEMVSAFKPSPPSPPPDGFLQEYFERDIETVLDFCNQHKGKSEDQLAIEIRNILLSGISNTRVGLYSKFHDNATYHLGYDNPITIRLAYMYENPLSLSVILSFLSSILTPLCRFTTCLDSGKSGLRVDMNRFRGDQQAWDYPLPDCMKKGGDYLENRTALPPASNHFILDVLMRKGEEIRNRHLKEYEEDKEKVVDPGRTDPDLTAPIARAIGQIGYRNQPIRDELMKLDAHVKKVRDTWRAYWGSKSGRPTVAWGKTKKSMNRLANARWIEELRDEFASGPGPEEIGTLLALDPCLVSKLKASIAAGSGEKFAFAMAYETLLAIKAEASGGISPIARSFGDILGVSPGIGRFYSQ